MTAVQTLRSEAKKAGNLKSGSQITVVQQSPQTIVIQPTNLQIVYVPEYNPTIVYGTPYVTPGYSTADVVATGVIAFGAGLAIGAMMSAGYGWGWSSWNCNWYGGGVYYHGGAYYGNAAWHGGYYSSGGAYGPYGSAHYGSAHYGTNYNPRTGTYAQGGSVSTPYGTRSAGQAYNPNTGAYGATRQGSNGYSNWGSSTVSKNGQTVDTQHYSGPGGSAAAAESSTGNKYATANGNAYKNTGNGWEKAGDSSAAHGWGDASTSHGWGQDASGRGSSAMSGFGGGSGGGWQSRSSSARGWGSRGGGGGWGGGSFGGGGLRGGGGRR